MTRKDAEQLHNEAESQEAWYRDHALDLWKQDYAKRFPRPDYAVNATEPGA